MTATLLTLWATIWLLCWVHTFGGLLPALWGCYCCLWGARLVQQWLTSRTFHYPGWVFLRTALRSEALPTQFSFLLPPRSQESDLHLSLKSHLSSSLPLLSHRYFPSNSLTHPILSASWRTYAKKLGPQSWGLYCKHPGKPNLIVRFSFFSSIWSQAIWSLNLP